MSVVLKQLECPKIFNKIWHRSLLRTLIFDPAEALEGVILNSPLPFKLLHRLGYLIKLIPWTNINTATDNISLSHVKPQTVLFSAPKQQQLRLGESVNHTINSTEALWSKQSKVKNVCDCSLKAESTAPSLGLQRTGSPSDTGLNLITLTCRNWNIAAD